MITQIPVKSVCHFLDNCICSQSSLNLHTLYFLVLTAAVVVAVAGFFLQATVAVAEVTAPCSAQFMGQRCRTGDFGVMDITVVGVVQPAATVGV